VYLEAFLGRHATDIAGAVLEVRDPHYATTYGGERVTRIDVLDIDPDNPLLTVLADLSDADSLPPSRWDCVICTQTLQYVPQLDVAVQNLWSAVRPNGTLLLSVPCITRADPKLADVDRWRFTGPGFSSLLAAAIPLAAAEVETYGNLTAAMAFLLGLAVEDLDAGRDLHPQDPAFSVVVCARVRKPGPGGAAAGAGGAATGAGGAAIGEAP
jgi:SAM-dependent methyltransferase